MQFNLIHLCKMSHNKDKKPYKFDCTTPHNRDFGAHLRNPNKQHSLNPSKKMLLKILTPSETIQKVLNIMKIIIQTNMNKFFVRI